MNRRPSLAAATWPLICLSMWSNASAQAPPDPDALTYRLPPQPVANLIDAPPTPDVEVSPDERWMLILESSPLPPISELAEVELRLAGLRIRPRTNGPSRKWEYRSLSVLPIEGGAPRPITGMPAESRIGQALWSPDSKHVAFTSTEATGIALWVAGVADSRARRLTEPRINAAYGIPCSWLADSTALICRMVPQGRGEAPKAPEVPAGPVIQESLGRKAPAPTYQDLLKSPHDERLLDHYLMSQVVRVGIDATLRPIGKPATILSNAPAPDGKHLLLLTLHRPYSYKVPIDRFPKRVEVVDLDGNVVRQITDQPLAEEVPVLFSAVRTGPREFEWRSDQPATLCWSEARDGGDPAVKAEIRDEVLCQSAPFADPATSLMKLKLRFGGLLWGDDELALVNEWWWETRTTKTSAVKPEQPESGSKVIWDRSWEDRYNDPGTPMMRRTPQGTWVLKTSKDGQLFLLGDGASTEGDRPFLDRFDLEAGKSERLWRSEAPHYGFVKEVLDDEGERVLIRRESNSEQPNYFLVDLKSHDSQQLTQFPHPSPELANVKKQLIQYQRADGVKLNAALYLPAGHDPARDGALPTVFWVYPQEFKSADAAGQVTDSPYRFVRVAWWSPLLFLTQGYAVVDDPTLPIVGEGDRQPNDTYVEQLVSGAEAAVNEVVRMGVADRERLGIGGHSYGAFTTANLLAHADLFRAGIARSGAYNRTLTPFSFQAEERTLWQARDVYIGVSPLMNADKIRKPLLLIHGEADNNQGTYPMQSERLFDALKGLGGTVRFVLLPHESHGYRARESVQHAWWEQIEWFDRYVKQAQSKNEPVGGQ